jgi:hypothetical protein
LKVYEAIAQALSARIRCENGNGNSDWIVRHAERIETIVKEHLPSGSGFDNGTQFDRASKPNRLVFNTAFHHMHESGMYDGWTDHQVIVTPDLGMRFDVRVTGRNRNDIKEYISSSFAYALNQEVDE